MSGTQVMEHDLSIVEKEVHVIAWETGAVQRRGKLDAATFVQTIMFGLWQDPEMRFSGLAHIGGRRDVSVTESAISQRFTSASANVFQCIMGERQCIERVRTWISRFSSSVLK